MTAIKPQMQPQFAGVGDKAKKVVQKAKENPMLSVGGAALASGLLIGDVPVLPDPALIGLGGAAAAEGGAKAAGFDNFTPFTYIKERTKQAFNAVKNKVTGN